MRIWMTERVSPDRAREMGAWAALLMLLAQHFFDGGLQDRHVASGLGAGLGVWLAFRFVARPPRKRTE